MISIRDLLDSLQKCCYEAEQLTALKREYNKLTRVLHCILKEHSGVISDEDWLEINSSEERTEYSFSVNENDKAIIETHV